MKASISNTFNLLSNPCDLTLDEFAALTYNLHGSILPFKSIILEENGMTLFDFLHRNDPELIPSKKKLREYLSQKAIKISGIIVQDENVDFTSFPFFSTGGKWTEDEEMKWTTISVGKKNFFLAVI